MRRWSVLFSFFCYMLLSSNYPAKLNSLDMILIPCKVDAVASGVCARDMHDYMPCVHAMCPCHVIAMSPGMPFHATSMSHAHVTCDVFSHV